MATYDDTRPRGYNANEGSFFSRILGSVRSWNDARVTRRALSQLTAEELDDIGLHRGDIERVARR